MACVFVMTVAKYAVSGDILPYIMLGTCGVNDVVCVRCHDQIMEVF